jgi:hypothetical protein
VDTAIALIHRRPAFERDAFESQAPWAIELFDAGLQEEAVHLIGAQIPSADEFDSDDAVKVLDELSFRWLNANPKTGPADAVLAIIKTVRSDTLRDSLFARQSNLFLAKGLDRMAFRFEQSITDASLRTATMLLHSRAVGRPEVRRMLQLELDGPATVGGEALAVFSPKDQWARSSIPKAGSHDAQSDGDVEMGGS